MGRLWIFFLGGRGRGRGTPGHVLQFVFTGRHEVPNSPFYVIYYIMISGGFTVESSDHREGAPGPRCPDQTRTLSKFRQPDDLFHTLKTVKGMLYLVPPRTPRISGYGVLCTCGLCYMLFLLYVGKEKNNGSWKRCLRAGFPEPVEGRRDRCVGWFRTGASEWIVLAHCTGTRPGCVWWGNACSCLL